MYLRTGKKQEPEDYREISSVLQHTLLIEIREIVAPEDLSKFDELVYRRDNEPQRHPTDLPRVSECLCGLQFSVGNESSLIYDLRCIGERTKIVCEHYPIYWNRINRDLLLFCNSVASVIGSLTQL